MTGTEAPCFMQPYADAGHDLDSLFRVEHYRCDRCGAYQIDLSEDLAYGEMRTCRTRDIAGKDNRHAD